MKKIYEKCPKRKMMSDDDARKVHSNMQKWLVLI